MLQENISKQADPGTETSRLAEVMDYDTRTSPWFSNNSTFSMKSLCLIDLIVCLALSPNKDAIQHIINEIKTTRSEELCSSEATAEFKAKFSWRTHL